jgi:predicted TPR repeat methyltransferase
MDSVKTFTKETIKEDYDNLSSNYEGMFLRAGFHDPQQCAILTNEIWETQGKKKEELTILDMGCGTGLVGKGLREFGFANITGLDASSGMIEEARKTKPGVYDDFIEMFLGFPDKYPENLKDKFDLVTASGILAENHLDCSVFDEMILSLKQGGIAIFATRTEYLTKYGYGDYMKKLADEGKWRYVKENTFSRYD